MQEKSKIQFAKINSLINRVEGKMTLMEAKENENNLIAEATSKNRVQVTRDKILDLINSADENSAGKFASITYVNAKPIYKTKRNWRADDVTSVLDKYSDRNAEDWHQKLSAYNQPDAKGNNPITSVIAVQRYILNWPSDQSYAKAYGKYKTDLSNLRMSYGIGLDSDGMLGDNRNQRTKNDYGQQFNQTGNMSKDFNIANSKVSSTAYFVNEEGNVVSEIPGDVVKTMMAPPSAPKPEKEIGEKLSPEEVKAYMVAKAELDKNFKGLTLLFDKILCICIGVNGVSYYYINDALASPIAKGGVNVNPQQMVEIAKEQLGESFDEIHGFAD